MKRALLLILAMAYFCIHVTSAWGVPPVNDDCANADNAGTLSAGVPVQMSGTVTDATRDCMTNIGPEVWVKFTLESCMDVTIDFCDYNDFIMVYSFDLHNECPCSEGIRFDNQDYCPNGNNSFTWNNLIPGTYYYPVEAEGFFTPTYALKITGVECTPPPANDNCGDAIPIGEVTNLEFRTHGASFDRSSDCISSGPNIWYIYTPTFSDTAHLEISGSNYNTVIAIYDGASCSPLPFEIGCTEESQFDFEVVSGNQYLIEIGGYNNQSGHGRLSINAIPEGPPNDNCANADDGGALNLGIPMHFTGNTMGATIDCMMYYWIPEVWIKFTVPSCMNVTIDFCDDTNSVTQTSEYLHTDCDCSSTIPDNRRGLCNNGNRYRTWYNVSPGTYYYPILENNDGGPYTINVTGFNCPPPPVPDFIIAAPYTGSSTTCGAGNDCYIGGVGEDRVYEVTIPTDGNWLFSLCNSDSIWDSYLYLGASICESNFGSNQQGCDNGHAELAAFGLEAGTYYLTIDSRREVCGEYTLDISNIPDPCEGSDYTNGSPDYEDGIYSYHDEDEDYFAADDFTIAEDITIQSIKFTGTYGGDGGESGDYLIMANNGGMPGDVLFQGIEIPCSYTPAGNQFNGYSVYSYQFNDLDIELPAGTYFLACRPISPSAYWLTTDSQTDSTAYHKDNDNPDWTLAEVEADLAFCIFATISGSPCEYMQGDINGDGQRIGGDVTFGVRYFKGTGGIPPDSCYMDSTSAYLYVSGDVNGNCEFRGSDITRLVAFFKGTAQLSYCHFFPPPVLRNSKAISPKLSGEN